MTRLLCLLSKAYIKFPGICLLPKFCDTLLRRRSLANLPLPSFVESDLLLTSGPASLIFLYMAVTVEASGSQLTQPEPNRTLGPGQTGNDWRPNTIRQTSFGDQTFYRLDTLFGAV